MGCYRAAAPEYGVIRQGAVEDHPGNFSGRYYRSTRGAEPEDKEDRKAEEPASLRVSVRIISVPLVLNQYDFASLY